MFENTSTLIALKNTLTVSTTVAMLSTLLAVPLAWLLTRTDFSKKEVWRSRLCLPYMIPSYISAIGWILLANPQSGFLNKIAGHAWINIYSFWGLVWVEVSFLFTFVLLTCLTSLEKMDPTFEEAARVSGASPRKVFFSITIPLLKNSIFSGFILSFLATAASFGVPALIGNPGRVLVLTTQIYTYQKMGTQNGIYLALQLSSLLASFAILLTFASFYLNKKTASAELTGKSQKPSLIELGKFQILAKVLVSFFWFLVFILPLTAIGISAFSEVQGIISFNNLSLNNFYRVFFETNETARSVYNSFLTAAVTATICALLAIILAFIQVKTKIKGRGLIEIISSIPYALPGTSLAIVLLILFNQSLAGTIFLILLAYTLKYFSLSLKTSLDGFRQVDSTLVEAARMSGANFLKSFKDIYLPLLIPSIIAGWFLTFTPLISELTMTQLLTGPGLETIGTLIFQLQEYSDITS